MTDKLPKKYVPSSLREPEEPKRTQVVYACGYEEKPGSYGMWAGPHPELTEMLEMVPEEPMYKPVIVRFNLDNTDEVLYRWSVRQRCWLLQDSKGRVQDAAEEGFNS